MYLNPRVSADFIVEGYRNTVDPVFVSQNRDRVSTFNKALSWIVKRYAISDIHDWL